MNKDELIKLSTKNVDAIYDYPFKDAPEDQYAVLRHKSNNKWFGLVFELDGELCINLKCNPFDAVMLRDMYDFIKPAWHMNKVHWNTVYVKKCSKELLENLINASFELTSRKKK